MRARSSRARQPALSYIRREALLHRLESEGRDRAGLNGMYGGGAISMAIAGPLDEIAEER